jgi:predicted metal-dependent peptidase
VAERVASSTRGSGKGSFREWADKIINPPVDPKAALRAIVRSSCDYGPGVGDYSFRRPSRRDYGDFLVSGSVQPIPRMAIVVDTSGSMGQKDLALALGLIGRIIQSFRLRDGVTVMCGDEDVRNVQKTLNPRNLELVGGGGTSMSNCIYTACKAKPKPQVILVVTDGETDWPSKHPGIPVVAAFTRPTHCAPAPPPWIKTIDLTPAMKEEQDG